MQATGQAYRPIPPERAARLSKRALQAYERGDFFERRAPRAGRMGTSDLAERALYQGLINAGGRLRACRPRQSDRMTRNLEGAREHLAASMRLDPGWGDAPHRPE